MLEMLILYFIMSMTIASILKKNKTRTMETEKCTRLIIHLMGVTSYVTYQTNVKIFQ